MDFNYFVSTQSQNLKIFLSPFLDPIGKPFIPLTQPLYDGFSYVGNLIGMDPFAILYLFCFFMNLPLAFLLRKLPAGTVRHVFCLVCGLFYSFLAFQWMSLHALFVGLVCYFISMVLPYKISHKIIFVFAMAYMTICHIYRMSIDYLGWSIDFTGLQMLVTWKVISAGFNYSDGQKLKNGEKLNTPEHERLSVSQLPNILQYLSYIFFFPTVLSGPVYELRDYLDFIDEPNPESNTTEVINRFSWALALSIFMTVLPKAGRENLVEPFITNISILEIFGWSYYTNIYSRIKYQTAWYFGEGSSIACGFGYDKEKKDWRKIKQADYLGVELATNLQQLTTLWNQSTSRFLRNYVYTRIGPPELHIPSHLKKDEKDKKEESKSKLLNLVAVFTTSALWHGLYFGYFSMFVVAAFFAQAHRWYHDAVRPIYFSGEKDFNKPEKTIKYYIYIVISWFGTHTFCAVNMVGFHVLSLADLIVWHQKTKWIGIIIIAAYFVIARLLARKKKQE